MKKTEEQNSVFSEEETMSSSCDFIDDIELTLEDLEYITGGAAHFPNLTVRP